MTSVKRLTDLTSYTSVLPYSSELFGVYQPLIGWKSKRTRERYTPNHQLNKNMIMELLKKNFLSKVNIKIAGNERVEIDIQPGVAIAGKFQDFDSLILQKVSAMLPSFDDYDPSIWTKAITHQNLSEILSKVVAPIYAESMTENVAATHSASTHLATERAMTSSKAVSKKVQLGILQQQLNYESTLSGALLFLAEEGKHHLLSEIFYQSKDNVEKIRKLTKLISSDSVIDSYVDLEHLNPRDRSHINAIALSPIGIVHLYRQYFFELDTFLGTPVSHVWLPPGSTVELIEVHTRRVLVEKTLENAVEMISKTEKSITDLDEISEAVKDENQRDIKFGASVTASYASVTASSSFDFDSSQKTARETTHKRMRQQTEKLSSEIRRNFKSTFKTLSEVTDVASSKHVLSNNTNELINYELRRKMRQVGVQVQDIGTFLCWQTFVDDPGKELGLSKLIHIAKDAELDGIPHPEEIPLLQAFQEEKVVTIPFISVENNADNKGEVYQDGVEVDDSEWFGSLEKIQADFLQEFVCPKSNYELTNVEFDPQGQPVLLKRVGAINQSGEKAAFTLHLSSVDFQGQNSIQVKLILHWSPLDAANVAITQKNADNLMNFRAQEKAAYEKAFVENVRDRVTMASKIVARKNEDLREEERIVVYRRLIHEMLLNGVALPDDRTRHAVSEVINSLFDVDKMLYFVAPEWWRPRLHRSKQQLTENPPTPPYDPGRPFHPNEVSGWRTDLVQKQLGAQIKLKPSGLSSSTVGWGGIDDQTRDNYYITDESDPAKLGSSLGWLMQLDGDNMRNAFLNAPWVKAVIPIRPGKEEAAINWLKGVEGMDGITDDVIYNASSPDEKDIEGNPLDGQKMIDVLIDLARKIKRKHEEGLAVSTFPTEDEVGETLIDDENTVTATPVDRVYEHGFYPLAGGFRANISKNYEIFDQWLEILPTDQVVPVKVQYDAKTGRQI